MSVLTCRARRARRAPRTLALSTAAAVALTGALAGAAAAPAAAAATPYRYVELPLLGLNERGDGYSEGLDLNAAGAVAGASTAPGSVDLDAALWPAAGRPRNLGAALDQAYAVNDRGVVAGSARIDGVYQAALLRSGRVTGLGTGYGDRGFSQPADVNGSGQVVGTHRLGRTDPDRAALFSGGTVLDLGTLGGGPGGPYGLTSNATAINDAGQVVGAALLPSGLPHAYLWQRGVMTDLGSLGGTSEGTFAKDINEAGVVVGSSQRRDGETHAVVWRDGVLTDLGALGPDFQFRGSNAEAVNNAGVVVGGTRLSGPGYGREVAALWRDGVGRDLNTLVDVPRGRRLLGAVDINDAGRILAISCPITECDDSSAGTRAVLLVPR